VATTSKKERWRPRRQRSGPDASTKRGTVTALGRRIGSAAAGAAPYSGSGSTAVLGEGSAGRNTAELENEPNKILGLDRAPALQQPSRLDHG